MSAVSSGRATSAVRRTDRTARNHRVVRSAAGERAPGRLRPAWACHQRALGVPPLVFTACFSRQTTGPAFHQVADRYPRQKEAALFLEGYPLGLEGRSPRNRRNRQLEVVAGYLQPLYITVCLSSAAPSLSG